MSELKKQIGVRIRQERKRLDKTQAQFGGLGGVGLTAQRNYECGARIPDALYLHRLHLVGVNTHFILTGARLPILPLNEEPQSIIETIKNDDTDTIRRIPIELGRDAKRTPTLAPTEGLGERLRAERRRLNFSQSQFATICGVSTPLQRNYESGKRSPDAFYLEALSVLGIDVHWLVTGQHRSSQSCPAQGRNSAVNISAFAKQLYILGKQLAEEENI